MIESKHVRGESHYVIVSILTCCCHCRNACFVCVQLILFFGGFSWEARGGVAITHKSTTETLKQWETMFGALQYGDTGSVGPSPRANEDSEVKLDQDAAATEPAPTNVASP